MKRIALLAVLLALVASGFIVGTSFSGHADVKQPPKHLWAEFSFDGQKYQIVGFNTAPPDAQVNASGPPTPFLPDRAVLVRSGELSIGAGNSVDGYQRTQVTMYDAAGHTRIMKLADQAGNVAGPIWPATNGSNGNVLYMSNASTGLLGVGAPTIEVLTGAAGDLITFSATDVRAAIAAAATGNVLISQGALTPPIYGKVGLTTHVTGTLAKGNGGTQVTAFPTREIRIPADLFVLPTTSAASAKEVLETSTNKVNYTSITFTDSGKKYAETSLVLPDDYDGGTLTGKIYWIPSASDASMVVQLGMQGRACAAGDAVDQAYGTAITPTAVAVGASGAGKIKETSFPLLTLAGTTPSAGQFCNIRIYRDTTADDYTGSVEVIAVSLTYQTTKF